MCLDVVRSTGNWFSIFNKSNGLVHTCQIYPFSMYSRQSSHFFSLNLEQIVTGFFFTTVSFYGVPEHVTKTPKKSQYGKALNLHNPKWPPNFNKLLYLGS